MDGVTVRIKVTGRSGQWFLQGGVPFLDLDKVPGRLETLGIEGLDLDGAEVTGRMVLTDTAGTPPNQPAEGYYLVTVTPKDQLPAAAETSSP